MQCKRGGRMGQLVAGVGICLLLVGCASGSAAGPTPDIGATVQAYVQSHKDELRGPQGVAGSVGASGPKGDRGDVGATGASGAAGPQGPAGLPGLTGPPGKDGAPGIGGVSSGVPGPAGPQGPPGPKGPSGGVADVQVAPCGLSLGYVTRGDYASVKCLILRLDKPTNVRIVHEETSYYTDRSATTRTCCWLSLDVDPATRNPSGHIFSGMVNDMLLASGTHTFYLGGQAAGNISGVDTVLTVYIFA